MYPNLYYFFKDAFGVEWEWSRFINSFGFFVAIAFFAAAYVLTSDLKRKEKKGLLKPLEEKQIFGQPAKPWEIALNAVLGFLFGYKIIGAFLKANDGINPQEFIFSSDGNFGAGLLLALLFGWLKWYEKNKTKMAKPEERIIRIWPHERVGDMTMLAAFFGFLGAKLFHNFENWSDFKADPIGSLLAFSGLTFYGGLICAAAAIIYYARKKKISVRHLADAFGPALILAYAIGRIGCQVSGDGDWGIPNSAYVADSTGTVRLAQPGEFSQSVKASSQYLLGEFGTNDPVKVPNASIKAPGFLPEWMVAYTYPHNVNSVGVKIAGCEGEEHCSYLPLPVFPTPFYETIAGLIIFLILILLRKRIKPAGALFGVYLFFNGLERFFVEKIRVNTKYEDLPFQPTQAELISLGLMIIGIFILRYAYKSKKTEA
ncbi:MAG: prolipoprotein diacylglyceryl transferase [Bacteroidota bacterium]|jgi:prolipoprotein diacylglyceryltransferase